MKITVFGATGFIGRYVVKALLNAKHEVTAICRDENKAAFLKQYGATVKYGDLSKKDTLKESINSADVIVSSAFPSFLGRMSIKRSDRDAKIGLTLMENLLETLIKVKPNIPIIRTEGTMGLGDSGNGWLNETSPHKFDTGYGRHLKYCVPYTEKIVKEYNLSVITMNISGAIGSGSWFKDSLYGMMKKGMFRVFGDGQNWISVIHVEDIAQAYRLAVEKLPIGQSFAIADDEPIKFLDFSNYLAEQMGKPPVKFFPTWLGKLMLGDVLLEAMTINQRISNKKAKAELGWQLKYPTYKEAIPAILTEIEKNS